MTAQEDLARRIERDSICRAVQKKIDEGKADFTDTARYTDRAAELLGMVLAAYVPDIPPDERETLCKALLRQRYLDTNAMLDAVQRALDDAQGLHLAPQIADYPEERVDQAAHSLADETVPMETIVRRAKSAPATIARSFHDDYIEKNAAFRSSAGLKCYITRNAATKCCEWCTRMAGRYRYGEEPEDVYRRHDNCSCTVTYESGRQRQDVWSKRTWEVPEPGAGAGERFVLTKEQAERLQAEHGLTKLPQSGKINKKMSASTLNPPDFSKYAVKQDLNAVEAVKQFMTEELGLSQQSVDLKGIQNADVLEPFAKRLKKIQKDTGMNFPSIIATEVIDGDACCIAQYSAPQNALYISSRFFNSKDALLDTMKEWSSQGFFPKQAKSVAYIAEHEAAHIRIPDPLLRSDTAVKIWKKRKLLNRNDNDIFEYYADVSAIYRLNMATTDSEILKVVEFLTEGGVKF